LLTLLANTVVVRAVNLFSQVGSHWRRQMTIKTFVRDLDLSSGRGGAWVALQSFRKFIPLLRALALWRCDVAAFISALSARVAGSALKWPLSCHMKGFFFLTSSCGRRGHEQGREGVWQVFWTSTFNVDIPGSLHRRLTNCRACVLLSLKLNSLIPLLRYSPSCLADFWQLFWPRRPYPLVYTLAFISCLNFHSLGPTVVPLGI